MKAFSEVQNQKKKDKTQSRIDIKKTLWKTHLHSEWKVTLEEFKARIALRVAITTENPESKSTSH